MLKTAREIDAFIGDPAHTSDHVEDLVRTGADAAAISTWLTELHGVQATPEALARWIRREIAVARARIDCDREEGPVCAYCDQQRVGPRDECGGVDEGYCLGRTAADDHALRAGRPRTAEEHERWLAETQAPFCVTCTHPLTIAELRAERNNGDYDETCNACESR